MPSFLIIYSSTDGHTKVICERITNALNEENLVSLFSIEDVKKLIYQILKYNNWC